MRTWAELCAALCAVSTAFYAGWCCGEAENRDRCWRYELRNLWYDNEHRLSEFRYAQEAIGRQRRYIREIQDELWWCTRSFENATGITLNTYITRGVYPTFGHLDPYR